MPTITSTNSNATWCTWIGTATTNCATSGTVWVDWCSTGSTTNTITVNGTNTAWTVWCSASGLASTHDGYTPPQLTDAQREAQRIASAAATARYEESARLRKEAEERAEKLLVENLDLRQRLEYQETKAFVVHGRSGKRFRIRNGRSGNVDVIGRNGVIDHRLCAHPSADVPNCDTMLAQKLLLEDDEERFLRVANRHAAIDNTTRVLPALH